MKSTPQSGDYVLATKWHDGDPGDHFAIGIYSHLHGDRHYVLDSDGKQFRANGFRRAEVISRARGEWLLSKIKEIEEGSRSVWWWKRATIGSGD